MKFSYIVYGLIIHSPFPLPDLIAYDGIADVVIRLNKIDPLLSNTNNNGTDFWVTCDGIFLFWEKEGRFLVRGGNEIVVDPLPGVDERVIRLLILGPALAVLLLQRGRVALHAATVEIDGNAIVFMGGSGCGKSALAATLYKRGHGVVADDVTAIQPDGKDGPLVFPGFPQLKLWPEVVSFLGDDPEKLPILEPGIGKRANPITQRFSEKPIPLRQIYVLAEGRDKELVPLSHQQALVELICHSYRAPVLKWIGAGRHLIQCASLINKIPIKRLNRPLLLSELPDVARMVEEDLAHV